MPKIQWLDHETFTWDNVGLIWVVFNDFVRNCILFIKLKCYEELEAFRGWCQFWPYIPSKPTKYGMEIITFVILWHSTLSIYKFIVENNQIYLSI